jgi:hypothetical protein
MANEAIASSVRKDALDRVGQIVGSAPPERVRNEKVDFG